MVRLAILAMLGSGCGKQLNADYCVAHPTDELCVTSDARVIDSRNVDTLVGGDAQMAAMIYVGTEDGELWGIDTVAKDATLIGVANDPVGGLPMALYALAYHPDGTIVAITSSRHLITVDPANADVMTRTPMAVNRSYIGLTVAPAGVFGPNAAILTAAQDTTRLYEVYGDGTTREIGSFGNGLTVAGDITWLPGVGLFASVQGSGCSGTCVASISHTTGAATLLASSGPGDMWAIASFGGEVWAVGGDSRVHSVDHTNGGTAEQFQTSISLVSDAAP